MLEPIPSLRPRVVLPSEHPPTHSGTPANTNTAQRPSAPVSADSAERAAVSPTARYQPGAEVHAHLMRHPEQRDAVYTRLVRTEPSLIHHLETWQRRDAVNPDLVHLADFRPLGFDALGQAPTVTPTPPDPAEEAERLLGVGDRGWFRGDDFEARQAAYATSLQQGGREWQTQLLAEIVKQDPNALHSWLEPRRINDSVANGDLSEADRTRMAQNHVASYNEGVVPQLETLDSGVVFDNVTPAGIVSTDPLESARRVDDFLDFVNAAGSTFDSRVFRQTLAQQLNGSYVNNDQLRLDDIYAGTKQTQAATLAALLVTGDASQPQMATGFLASMTAGERSNFLDRAENGSWALTAAYLGPQLEMSPGGGMGDTVDTLAQPDALSALALAVSNSQGPTADALAVELAHAPGDHERWFNDNPDRAAAWTELLASHSQPILDDLTDPEFLPVVDGVKPVPAFTDGVHDLGALLRTVNDSGDTALVDRARGVLLDYAGEQRELISSAMAYPQATAAGGRLGILAAGVTESVNLALEDYAQTQEQKRALVGFALDLVVAAVPAGGLASKAVGDWLEAHVGSAVAREALDGLSGDLIGGGVDFLSDPLKNTILDRLGDGELDILVAALQESNGFIHDQLIANLPAPGYEPGQAGSSDTFRDVQNGYLQALNWVTR